MHDVVCPGSLVHILYSDLLYTNGQDFLDSQYSKKTRNIWRAGKKIGSLPQWNMGVHWVSTVCPLGVHWVSTGCPLGVHWMSTGCQPDVNRMSTGRQPDVNRMNDLRLGRIDI